MFAAYVVSFFVIGIVWVNHHALFTSFARVDRALMFLNLLLLLWIVAIPFATSTMATYLRTGGGDAHLAAALYAAVLEGMGLSFASIFVWSLRGAQPPRAVAAGRGARGDRAFHDRRDRLPDRDRARLRERARLPRPERRSSRSTTSSNRPSHRLTAADPARQRERKLAANERRPLGVIAGTDQGADGGRVPRCHGTRDGGHAPRPFRAVCGDGRWCSGSGLQRRDRAEEAVGLVVRDRR